MKKKQKAILITVIFLFCLLIILISQSRPLQISEEESTYAQIPKMVWVIIFLLSLLLFVLVRKEKRWWALLAYAVFYYFIFYSITLLFLIPLKTIDCVFLGKEQSILLSTSHIGMSEINLHHYFRWPIFHIFSKSLQLVLGIGPIKIINLGFLILILILPILINFFMKERRDDNLLAYFLVPSIYIVASYNIINDQFVPQFLALLFLILTFACYIRIPNRKFLILTLVFFFVLVLTHPFLFVFVVLSIALERITPYLSNKNKKSQLPADCELKRSGVIVILFMVTISISVIAINYDFIKELISSLVDRFGELGGEGWLPFKWIFPGHNLGYAVYPLYQSVPKMLDFTVTLAAKMIVTLLIVILSLGFLLMFKKRRDYFSIGIILGSSGWFALGIIDPMILGQRAFQIAFLPLSKFYNAFVRFPFWNAVKGLLLVLVFISPLVFNLDIVTNTSLNGERLVQDPYENYAGKFMDSKLTEENKVLVARNLYPSTYPGGFTRIEPVEIKKRPYIFKEITTMLISSKIQKRFQYLGLKMPKEMNNFDRVYHSNCCSIIFKEKFTKSGGLYA